MNLDSLAIGIETIIVFVYNFYYLYQEFRNPQSLSIVKNPMFWVVSGMIFYLAGSFFFNILANHFSEVEWNKYWYYSYSFDIIKNVLFAIAITFFAKQNRKNIKEITPYLDIDHLDIDRIIKHN